MKKIDNIQNRQLHTLLSQLGLMEVKKDLIEGATGGRSTSSTDLYAGEAKALISRLQTQREVAIAKTRGKIIHLMCLLGYVTEEGQPDYTRINQWVKNCGKNNKQGKQLSYLTISEMNRVCTQVQAWYKKEIANESTGADSVA